MKLLKKEPIIEYEEFDMLDDKILKIWGISEDMKYDFITPTEKYLNSPFMLKNMDKAVEMVQQTIIDDVPIEVYLDVDTDGVTSAQIIYGYLKLFTENVSYVAHQRDEGHGIIVDRVSESTKLLIVVDSSTNSVEECKELSERGVKVLVIDHHHSDVNNPYATIVNPQMCDYPNKELSGAGVCWQFARAFDEINGIHYANDFVDLACVGMVGDMMSLMEMETRYIVWAGLMNINNKIGNTGLLSLFKALRKDFNPTSQDISFYIAPCLNAVIRLGDINLIMDLFNEEDSDVTALICKDILAFNEDRKKLTEDIVESLEGKLSDDKITIVDMTESGFKRGMFGLIASKISKEKQRPCFFGSVYDDEFKGSARGFGDHIDLKDILKDSGLFTLVAGHQNAFGVGFKVDKMQEIKDFVNDRFENDYNEIVAEYDLEIDYEDMDEHSLQLIDDISFICGQGFRRPTFLVKGLTIDKMAKIGKDKNHTKLSKEDEMNLDIMKFNTKETLDHYEEADYIDVVGNIGLNKFYNFGLKKVVVSKQILANEIICQTIDI